MTADRYRVVFQGEVLSDRTVEEVKERLTSLLKIDRLAVEQLFSKKPVLLKRSVDYETAVKYKRAFAMAGAVCRIEKLEEPLHVLPVETPASGLAQQHIQPQGSAPGADDRGQQPRASGKEKASSHRPGPKSKKRRYSVLHPFFMSFFSRALYQDVARNWRGFAFLYLLLLVALCTIPKTISIHTGLSDFIRNSAPQVLSQIPEITISQGRLSTDREEPYFIRDPEGGENIAVIDTTGRFDSLDDVSAHVLVTKTHVMFRRSQREIRTFDLSGIEYFRFDHTVIYRWVGVVAKWLAIALFPVILLGSFVYRIIQALIYGLIGVLFSKITKISLGYQALVRLAIMAVTPAIILGAIRDIAQVPVRFWWLWCFLIAMAFLFFGVKANGGRYSATAPPMGPSPRSFHPDG